MSKHLFLLAVALLPVLGEGQEMLLEKKINNQALIGSTVIGQATSTTRESLLVKNNGDIWYIVKSKINKAVENDSSGQKVFSEKRRVIGEFTTKIKTPTETYLLAYFNNERPVIYDSTKKACYGTLGITKTSKTSYKGIVYCEKEKKMKATFSQVEKDKIIFWPIVTLILFAVMALLISFLSVIKKISESVYNISFVAWAGFLGMIFTFLVTTNNLGNPNLLQIITQVILWPIAGSVIGIIIAGRFANMQTEIYSNKKYPLKKIIILIVSLFLCLFFSMIVAGAEENNGLFLLNQIYLFGVMILSIILSALISRSIEAKKVCQSKT